MADALYKLLYRKPGSSEYQLINEVLDELFNRLDALELDEDDLKVGLTD